MRYDNIDALDTAVEKVISRKVKHYYTDWKNYDRPKYMRFKGSNDRNDKKFLILIRECGTYIVRACDVYKQDWATTLFEYFQNQEKSDYYFVNLDRYELKKVDPEAFGLRLRTS